MQFGSLFFIDYYYGMVPPHVPAKQSTHSCVTKRPLLCVRHLPFNPSSSSTYRRNGYRSPQADNILNNKAASVADEANPNMTAYTVEDFFT